MSDAVLRALVIAPTPTWPLNYGNRKRIFSVCSSLQDKGYEIHYIHYVSEGDWRDYIPVESRKKMQEQWEVVDHVMPSIPLHDWPKYGEDHLIDEWWDWSLENHIKQTLASRSFDVVIVNYTWLSKALELVPKDIVTVLDTHDKFSERRELLEKNGLGKEFFHTTAEEELKGLDRANLVWAIKQEEQYLFEAMGTTAETATLLHIDDLRESSCPPVAEFGVVFGFVGANNNINKKNLMSFIEVAEPIFKKYCPPLTVHIAGSICKSLKPFDSSYFTKLGYIDSIDAFYDDIHVAITPMSFSTGLKIKVAEALSQSKAIISHSHAFEGFADKHEFHICNNFEKLALAMCQVAYEVSEIDYLTQASKASYANLTEQIDNTFEQLHSKVIDKKKVLIILPEKFGDEDALEHWLAKARLELLSWNFSNITQVKLSNPLQASVNNKDIRYIDSKGLYELVNTFNFELIYCLEESIPENLELDSIQVISDVQLPSSYSGSNVRGPHYFSESVEGDFLPALGHLMPTFFEKSEDELGTYVGVIGKPTSNVSKYFVDYIAQNLEVEILDLSSFVDINELIDRQGVLPEKMVILKQTNDLNRYEQCLIDICLKYGVALSFNSSFNINQLTNKNSKTKYTEEFFGYWQLFVDSLEFSNKKSLY